MKLNFFSSPQRDRILFLISLPQNQEFMIHSASVARCINQIKKMGVDVAEDINADILAKASQYDVVIVVAHLDNKSNELVLSNNKMPLEEFVTDLPKDFSGTLDFSSCNSSIVYDKIKEQCPNSIVKTANEEVGLNLRLSVYPSFLKRLLKKHKKSYDQIYEEELKKAEFFYNRINSSRATSIQRSQKLGKAKSAIFVPIQIVKSSAFQIVIKLHQDEASETMSFKSLYLDSNRHIQVRMTTVPIRPRDKFSARLQFITEEKEMIHFLDEQDTFELNWQGGTCEKAFQAVIDPTFSKPFLIGRLTISINENTMGECIFSTKVAKETSVSILDVPLIPHQSEQAPPQIKAIINAYTEGQIASLKSRLTKTESVEKQSAIEKDISDNEGFLSVIKELFD